MERAPRAIVIDASVAVKWFVRELGSDQAILLRDGLIEGKVNLVAPDLLLYEVVNALQFHRNLSLNMLKENVGALLSLDLDLAPPSSELLKTASTIAERHGLTVYDSTYLALAQSLSTSLVTADEYLIKRGRGRTDILRIRDLGERWHFS